MRLDRVIFDGENPFNEFSKCKELTILLAEDSIILVATINSINLMTTFSSEVTIEKGEQQNYRTSYTVPLSLMLPLFRLDGKKKGNELEITSDQDSAVIKYNGVEVTTSVFSPNGLTIQQIQNINTAESMEVSPGPFISMYDVFGITMDNYCNVDGKTLFISDESKCLIHDGEQDYGRKFSVSIDFIRMMKAMACTKLFIGANLVAQTKSGMLLVTSLTKVTDPNVLLDYRFAARLKSDEVYTLAIARHLKQIALAVKSAELSLSLDLTNKKLELYSMSNESVVIPLAEREVAKDGAGDFNAFNFLGGGVPEEDPVVLNDARLVRTLASFRSVRVKVCPTVMIARLGDTHKLMFTLGGRQ